MPFGADYLVAPLTPEDLPHLQQLYAACSDYMVLVTGSSPDANEAAHLLNALPPGVSPERKLVLGLRDQDHRLLGAVDVIKGFPHPKAWYVGEFMIAPYARGLGFGRTLFNEVRTRAESAGASRIDLAVHEANAAALVFWSRIGFEETGRAEYQIKGHASQFVLMSAVLGSPCA